MKDMMADYVKLPELEEYKDWFKDHFDLYREDGILQVTMKTNNHRMCWSGSSHRAMSQLSRVISLDRKNEIIIWTHKGDYWMTVKDPNGWNEYNRSRFEHQYIDDQNLIKNMIFDLDVPTIGAIPGPGYHWDSAILCDVTVASEDCVFDDDHMFMGQVAGDGMFMLLQHFLGTKRANYYMYTCRQFTAQNALDWGWVSEIAPKGKVVERAWEIARVMKSLPYETRTIASYLAKRPLEHLLADDLKLHTVNEQYSTVYRIAQQDYGTAQHDESDMTRVHHFRYRTKENAEYLQSPIRSFTELRAKIEQWCKDNDYVSPDVEFGYVDAKDADPTK